MKEFSEFDKSLNRVKDDYKKELGEFIVNSKKEEEKAKKKILEELEKKTPFQDDEDERIQISKEWKIFFIVLISLATIIGIVYLLMPKTVELRVVNLNPYNARFAVSYFDQDSTIITQGWYSLQPGEERMVELTIPKWLNEEIYYYAESDDYEAIDWISGGVHNYVTFNYSHDELEYRFAAIDTSFHVLSKIAEGSSANEKVLELVRTPKDSTNYEILPFVKINTFKSKGLFGLAYEVRKKLIGSKYNETFSDNESKRVTWCKQFYASIQRNLRYIASFPTFRDYPYHPGFNPSDKNVLHEEGLAIDDTPYYNLFGENFTLLPNDVLLSFNGKQIFNYGDLLWYLNEHASSRQSGGIAYPIKYTIAREGRIYTMEERFFFNPIHYEDSSFDAAFLGFSSSLFFNQKWAHHGANYLFRNGINILFDAGLEIEERWDYDQRLYRLKQFFPEEFDDGATLGLFVPNPVSILSAARIARAFKGGSKLSQKILKTGAYISLDTFADMAIYSNSASMLRPKETIDQNFDEEFKFSLGTNVLLGIFMSR